MKGEKGRTDGSRDKGDIFKSSSDYDVIMKVEKEEVRTMTDMLCVPVASVFLCSVFQLPRCFCVVCSSCLSVSVFCVPVASVFLCCVFQLPQCFCVVCSSCLSVSVLCVTVASVFLCCVFQLPQCFCVVCCRTGHLTMGIPLQTR